MNRQHVITVLALSAPAMHRRPKYQRICIALFKVETIPSKVVNLHKAKSTDYGDCIATVKSMIAPIKPNYLAKTKVWVNAVAMTLISA